MAAYERMPNLCDTEIWYPEEMPVSVPLPPECAVVRAVDPSIENQDFSSTHPGGWAWDMMLPSRSQESRSRRQWRATRDVYRTHCWKVFRQVGRGIAAPPSDLLPLLKEGRPDVMEALSRPLRLEPMVFFRRESPFITPTIFERDPQRWRKKLSEVLQRWPGPLTLVLNQGVLFGWESMDTKEWHRAFQEILEGPLPRLVGLEVNLPGLDIASMDSRHCSQLRHLALRGVTGAQSILDRVVQLDVLRLREVSGVQVPSRVGLVDADIQSLASLPETMDRLYLRGEWDNVTTAFPLLSSIRAVSKLSLDYSGIQLLYNPEELADALRHLGLRELAMFEHWEVKSLHCDEGYDAWIACLRALCQLPGLTTLRLPVEVPEERSDALESAIDGVLGGVERRREPCWVLPDTRRVWPSWEL